MPTSEQYLLQRLRDTEDALRRQLEAIDREAARAHVPSTELRATDGAPLAAPVLVALANIQIALLARPSVGTCGVTDCVDHAIEDGRRLASQRDDLIAQGVDPADLLIPLAPTEGCGVEVSEPGQPSYVCGLPRDHEGEHDA